MQLWRRAWRDKILPALINFHPDLIILSSGFDAHSRDDVNQGYISVQERDFEWLTEQVEGVGRTSLLLSAVVVVVTVGWARFVAVFCGCVHYCTYTFCMLYVPMDVGF